MLPGLAMAAAGEPSTGAALEAATQAATWARDEKPSLSRIRSTCPSAVLSAMKRRSAICRLVRPAATSLATSSSRFESPSEPAIQAKSCA